MLISKLEKGRGRMKAEEKIKIMEKLWEVINSIDRTRQDIKTKAKAAVRESKILSNNTLVSILA